MLDEHDSDTIVEDGKAQVNRSVAQKTFRGAALLLICMLVMIGGLACSDNGEDSDEIGVEQATDLLNRAVEYATSHDLDKLCGLSSSSLTCRKQWEDAGEWDAVPAEPPQVVDTYLIPTRKLENGMTQRGGRLLVVSGVDGKGRPYRTDMLICDGGWMHGLSATNVIYWSGASIQFDGDGSSTTTRDSGPQLRLSQSSIWRQRTGHRVWRRRVPS